VSAQLSIAGVVGVRKRVMAKLGDHVRHLGVTATPREGVDAFGRPAFEYGVWRAVEDGYLVKPFLAYEISSDISIDGVPLTKDGDFDSVALGRRMSEAGPVAAVVKAAVKWSNYSNAHGSARPTVVCCSSVDHAKIVAGQLNEWHRDRSTGRAAAIYGEQEPGDRLAAMDAFKRGELRYLCHFDCLTEGFDHDECRVLINGRPTKSQWVFAQNAGRVLRPLRHVARQLGSVTDSAARRKLIADSAKPGAMIVDVAGVDHKLTVDLASVFHAPGDEDLVDAVRQRGREKNGKPLDPTIDFAELRRIKEQKLMERWRGIRVDATLTTRMGDPFDVLAIVTGREPRWAKGKKPTDGWVKVLLGAGIPKHEVDAMSFHRAKAIVDVIFKRRDSGLCTYKQARLLKEYGYDGACMTKDEATALIDRIAKDGWRKS
jgi:superfamily II DNA or RNA helicase